MKILFMGTPDFAVFSLRALVRAGFELVGVVTQPDKPKGRGYSLTPPPVKQCAMELGLPVYQPATLRGEEFAALLEELSPDLIAVVAYGKLLPKTVLEFPRFGCVNVHGSLLPKYRGAAPMQRAILEGEAVTGITTMQMAEGLDTGDMFRVAELPIQPNDNFETIHDKLGALGAETLVQTVRDLENGTAVAIPQEETGATYAAKITKEDCRIRFEEPAKAVHDRIRGLSPVPLAYTRLPDGKLLKVLEAVPVTDSANGTAVLPGTVIAVSETGIGGITVACGDGSAVTLLRLRPEGKGNMDAAAFLRGRKLNVGDRLE